MGTDNKKTETKQCNIPSVVVRCSMRGIEEIKETLKILTELLDLTPNDVSIKIQKETLEWVLGNHFGKQH